MGEQEQPESNYLLPYNDLETRRLRLQHDLIKSYMGTLVLAPIDLEMKGLKVLDSGTFDGIATPVSSFQVIGYWLSEAAKLMQEPILVGTDISPVVFPLKRADGPSFYVQSVTEPWPKEWKGTFDLVHQRLVLAGTTPEIGRGAVKAMVELAKPGTGWVQFVEGALQHLSNEQKAKYPSLYRFQNLCGRMLPGLGWNPKVGLQIKGWLEELGLDVSEKIMEIPVGVSNPDPRLGAMAKQNLLEVVENFREAARGLPEGFEVSAQDFDDVLNDIKIEVDTVGELLRFNCVWGRRQQ
ncbi:hypothetical protein BP6252_07499 [Coleophoma cylindrospora]|uniref:Uncharacterized protein n=1 Tax=Coleophoma cylindrospora TaxID=1849047 RepID=A0A3D8RAD9_9HELO|nr:hypothetical protein BP6252_07499 [Coleophoma cylindrospora]